MANFKDSKTFAVHDDYYTPKSAWINISQSIPKDKKIWEACMLGAELSQSDNYIRDITKGVVIGDRELNCLEDEPVDWDIIITNIPFDIKKKVPILKKFLEFDKPFIVIINSLNTFTKYFQELIKNKEKDIQIITPSFKINFDKLENGCLTPTKTCSFYCVYVCYKLNLPAEQLWI